MPQWERDLKVKGEARKKKSGLLGILAGDDKWSAHQPENAVCSRTPLTESNHYQSRRLAMRLVPWNVVPTIRV